MAIRVLAAAIAGGITFFILGFLIFGLALENMVMKPNMNSFPGLMNEVPLWAPLVIANIVSGLLLAYIFDQWAGFRTFAEGAKGGAIVWFLISLSFQLMFLAFMNLHKNYIPVIADIAASTIMGAIGGGVVAQVLGIMNKQETPADA